MSEKLLRISILTLWMSFIGVANAQEYSFDLDDFEKKPYEYSAILTFNPVFSILNTESRLYQLKYLNSDSEKFLHETDLSLELSGSYEIKNFKFISVGKYNVLHSSENDWDDEFSLFELYAQHTPNTNFTTWLGKKNVKWGKGYIWNPVSFAGRQKDVDDVDASLEGYSLIMGEFVKSFDSTFKTLSIAPVIIPVTADLNDDFSKTGSFNFVLQTYMLITDTDVGLYLFWDDHDHHKFGLDFARNLLTNWEVHAEWAYENIYDKLVLDKDYSLRQTSEKIENYLLGTRYLTSLNTTIIFEYLHNNNGFSESEMDAYFEATDDALSNNNDALISILKSFQKEQLNRQFLMQNYLYCKVSHPEPFNLLYFTPSMNTLYNLNDNSYRVGLEMNYSRFKNLELIIRQNYFPPNPKTEFGEKMTHYKIEFHVKKYL